MTDLEFRLKIQKLQSLLDGLAVNGHGITITIPRPVFEEIASEVDEIARHSIAEIQGLRRKILQARAGIEGLLNYQETA
jgi:hypothetical protein